MKNLQIILLTLAFAANCMEPDEHERQRLKRAAECKQETEPVKKPRTISSKDEDFNQFEGLKENPQNINEYFSALPEDMKREIFKNIFLDLIKSYINSSSPNKNKIFFEQLLKLKTINKAFQKIAEYYIPAKKENEFAIDLNENLLTFAADRNWINFWNLILDNIVIDQETLNNTLMLFMSNKNYQNKQDIDLIIKKLFHKGAKIPEHPAANVTISNIIKGFDSVERNQGQTKQEWMQGIFNIYFKALSSTRARLPITDFCSYIFLKFLINNGLDPNLINSVNFVPRFSFNNLQTINYKHFRLLFEKRTENGTDINDAFRSFIAFIANNIRVERTLDQFFKIANNYLKFADINSQDYKGQTVLFYILKNNSLRPLFEYFLENGADINITDIHGQNLLFEALKEFHSTKDYNYDPIPDLKTLLDMLISKGLNINARDNNGQTILFKVYYIDAIKLLLEKHMINPNIKNNNGETALFHLIDNGACKYSKEFEKKINSFVASGANINEQNNDGETILFYLLEKVASREIDRTSKEIDLKSAKKALNILLEYGLNLNIQDNNGQTALFKCRIKKKLEFMLSFNPLINIKDNAGMTILDYICANNKCNKLAEILRTHGAKLSSELSN